MVKYTKLFISFISVVFLSTTLVNSLIHAETDKQRIFDFASILSEQEVQELEQIAQKYSQKRETDFIILTNNEGEEDVVDIMGDFYDDEGLGYDKKHGNTAIITLDMVNRDVQLAGFGKAEEFLPDERLDLIRENITPDLSDGNYKTAFEDFITLSSRYMQFKVGANPANPFYNPWIQIFIALLIGVGVVWALARNPGMKTTVNSGTYQDEKRSKVLKKRDRYVRTTVTKKRKPKSNSGGGRGGGRSGGGGFTGGGRSFSGSRGKF